MRLQRLWSMTPTEIMFRTRQQATRVMERMNIFPGRKSDRSPLVYPFLLPLNGFDEVLDLYIAGARARADELLYELYWENAEYRFFAGLSDGGVAAQVTTACPAACRRIVETADAVCRGRFEILGYGELHYGEEPDWHLDIVAEKRTPLLHWTLINPLDESVTGDCKVVWELNRHQWLLDLGQAYRYTGDERYADRAFALIRSWMQHNKPGYGINWCSALEVSLRIVSWTWALFLFRGCVALDSKLFAEMLAWIRAHASYVERNLSYYFSPNTHLTGEALGLVYVGLVFPELRGAQHWARLGKQILEQQIIKQVSSDGVYFEQSTRYQQYTIEIYLHLCILSGVNGWPCSAALRQRLVSMLDFMVAVRGPDGSMPQIGDGDGGWLLPLLRRSPADMQGMFTLAAVYLKRSDYAWPETHTTPESLWLLGNEARQTFERLPMLPTRGNGLCCYPEGGYGVIRSSRDAAAHQAILDCGPLGCPVTAAHGHADLLSFQCSVYGEPYIADPGTGNYLAGSEWRDYFRSTMAHSAVVLDGKSQATPDGTFSWECKPAASLRDHSRSMACTVLDAWHDAYSNDNERIIHRRRMVFVQSQYWVLVDDIEVSRQHHIDLRFQFSPIRLFPEAEGWSRACGNNGKALLVKSFSSIPLLRNIQTGERNPLRGWWSGNYGQVEPAPALSISSLAQSPVRIVTVLYPVPDAHQEAPDITSNMSDDIEWKFVIGRGSEGTLFVSNDTVRIEDSVCAA